MYITTKRGIFIIYGPRTSSKYKNINEGQITLKTTTPFKDQKGVTRSGCYTWVVNITNGQTRIINPESHYGIAKWAVVEATPYDDYENFWYYPNGKEKKRLRLKALFVSKIEEYNAQDTPTGLIDAVEYEPKRSSYLVWWRSDEIDDNHPLVTGIRDPYLEGGPYGDHMQGGYKDPMRSDMEFFYEDERWSRDP